MLTGQALFLWYLQPNLRGNYFFWAPVTYTFWVGYKQQFTRRIPVIYPADRPFPATVAVHPPPRRSTSNASPDICEPRCRRVSRTTPLRRATAYEVDAQTGRTRLARNPPLLLGAVPQRAQTGRKRAASPPPSGTTEEDVTVGPTLKRVARNADSMDEDAAWDGTTADPTTTTSATCSSSACDAPPPLPSMTRTVRLDVTSAAAARYVRGRKCQARLSHPLEVESRARRSTSMTAPTPAGTSSRPRCSMACSRTTARGQEPPSRAPAVRRRRNCTVASAKVRAHTYPHTHPSADYFCLKDWHVCHAQRDLPHVPFRRDADRNMFLYSCEPLFSLARDTSHALQVTLYVTLGADACETMEQISA